jgi:hypothetical protein
MTRFLICVGAMAVCILVSSSADAACRIMGFRFYPAQNDSVSTTGVITGGTACTHPFRAGGTLRFNSASIASRPSNGTLTQTGALSFRYQPRAGFKGSDQYSLKVCGTGRSGIGCSTITYRMTIN